jgi:drug/metabolite transporter (DMT)-like permease
MPPVLLANLGLLLVVTLWGAQVPVANDLAQRWDPFFLAAMRYVAALPLFWLLLWLLPVRQSIRSPVPLSLLRFCGLGLATTGFAVFYMLGVAWANPITSALVAATGPIIGALVLWVLTGLRPARSVGLGLLAVVPGALLITLDFSRQDIRLELSGGEPLIMLALACWSVYSLLVQRWLAGRSQLRITAISVTATVPPICIVYLLAWLKGLTYGDYSAPSETDLLAFAYLVLGALLTAVTLWNIGVSQLGLVVAAMYLNLIPIVAVVIAVLYGVYPRPEQLIGGGLVIIGVVVAQRLGRPRSIKT